MEYLISGIRGWYHETRKKSSRHDFWSFSIQILVLVYLMQVQKIVSNRSDLALVLDLSEYVQAGVMFFSSEFHEIGLCCGETLGERSRTERTTCNKYHLQQLLIDELI